MNSKSFTCHIFFLLFLCAPCLPTSEFDPYAELSYEKNIQYLNGVLGRSDNEPDDTEKYKIVMSLCNLALNGDLSKGGSHGVHWRNLAKEKVGEWNLVKKDSVKLSLALSWLDALNGNSAEVLNRLQNHGDSPHVRALKTFITSDWRMLSGKTELTTHERLALLCAYQTCRMGNVVAEHWDKFEMLPPYAAGVLRESAIGFDGMSIRMQGEGAFADLATAVRLGLFSDKLVGQLAKNLKNFYKEQERYQNIDGFSERELLEFLGDSSTNDSWAVLAIWSLLNESIDEFEDLNMTVRCLSLLTVRDKILNAFWNRHYYVNNRLAFSAKEIKDPFILEGSDEYLTSLLMMSAKSSDREVRNYWFNHLKSNFDSSLGIDPTLLIDHLIYFKRSIGLGNQPINVFLDEMIKVPIQDRPIYASKLEASFSFRRKIPIDMSRQSLERDPHNIVFMNAVNGKIDSVKGYEIFLHDNPWRIDVLLEVAAKKFNKAERGLMDYSEAALIYERIRELDLKHEIATVMYGFCLAEMGKVDEALAYLETHVESETIRGFKLIPTRLKLAKLYFRKGDLDKAESYYRKAAESRQYNAVQDYAYFLQGQERYEEAREWFQYGVKRYGGKRFSFALAWSYLRDPHGNKEMGCHLLRETIAQPGSNELLHDKLPLVVELDMLDEWLAVLRPMSLREGYAADAYENALFCTLNFKELSSFIKKRPTTSGGHLGIEKFLIHRLAGKFDDDYELYFNEKQPSAQYMLMYLAKESDKTIGEMNLPRFEHGELYYYMSLIALRDGDKDKFETVLYLASKMCKERNLVVKIGFLKRWFEGIDEEERLRYFRKMREETKVFQLKKDKRVEEFFALLPEGYRTERHQYGEAYFHGKELIAEKHFDGKGKIERLVQTDGYYKNGLELVWSHMGIVATTYKNNVKHGEYREWHGDDGPLRRRWTYVDGVRHGLCEEFDYKGNKISSYTLNQGSGKVETTYPDGTVSRYNLIKEQMDGWVESFYANGKPRVKSYYVQGKKEGVSVSYNMNGSIWHISWYVSGRRHGPNPIYDTYERPDKVRYYLNGRKVEEADYLKAQASDSSLLYHKDEMQYIKEIQRILKDE